MHLYSLPFHALVVALCVLISTRPINGHSEPTRPLKRLAHPSTISLEIIPRQLPPPSILSPTLKRADAALSRRSNILRHDDSFRLVLVAFGETFHLHLRPNEHLIHPAARIHYYSVTPSGDSVITHTKPLLRESVKAYLGEVVKSEHSPTRLREDAAQLSRPQNHPHRPDGDLGWARIVVHHQGDMAKGIAPVFEGAFSSNGIVHHIKTKDNYLRHKHGLDSAIDAAVAEMDSGLVIWRDSDVMTPEEAHHAATGEHLTTSSSPGHSCGHDRLPYNVDPAENVFLQKPLGAPKGILPGLLPTSLSFGPFGDFSIYKRDDAQGDGMSTNFEDRIGQTQGCSADQRLVYMGVAADCEYVSTYGSRDNATQQILTNWNTASSLYKTTFNISLGIVELQVQDPTCPSSTNSSVPWNTGCSDSVTLNDRLSIFSQWRGDKGDDGIGLWHLMSGCPTGTEVGIAWLATLCQQSTTGSQGSFVSGTAVSTGGQTEWQVVAHEIGHNFGAIHDCADGCNSSSSCCPLSTSTCSASSQFIMSPVAQSSEQRFSQCTLGNICSVLGGVEGSRLNSSCLVSASDSTRTTISLQMCGNGIVEDGEDCDPGSGVSSNCCDSSTCKFRSGAVCDPASSPCCSDQCSFAPSSQVCRPSKDDQCDTAEFCTGSSSACPSDVFAPNGQGCGDGLACASGQCTSVSQQCRTVGASLNLTTECPNHNSATCQISCQDPEHANQCVLLSAMLIDGSPCGFGGTCVSGTCQSGSFLDTAKAWYVQNLQISIPVTIAAGLIALVILYLLVRCILGACRRRKVVAAAGPGGNPTMANLRHARLQSFDPTAPQPTYMGSPPSMPYMTGTSLPAVPSATRPRRAHRHRHSNSRSNWVDESVYNGSGPARMPS